MQMFGVGVLELMVILILAVLVVGPDRMPQIAADLGRWIRQTRAYAKHLMGDFNDVVTELEKEAGASREDWKEVANVVTRHTGAVGKEFSRFGKDVEESGDLAEIKSEATTPKASENGVDSDSQEEAPVEDLGAQPAAAKNGTEANGTDAKQATGEDGAEEEEKPWYVPERASRRRPSD